MATRKFRLFGRDIVIGKRLFGLGKDDDGLFGFLQKYGMDFEQFNKLESYKGVVYSCVSLLGQTVGGYQPIIERLAGDQYQRVDHEFLRLLERPSGRDPKADSMSQYDLFEAVESFMDLQGEVFLYFGKGRITGKPREIVILRPDKTGIAVDPDTGDVTGYFVRRQGKDPIPLAIDEVLHIKTFNPKNPYRGLSIAEAGQEYIQTDESTVRYTRNFFLNNAGLSGLLTLNGDITKPAFKKFVRQWRQRYEGVDNAGKVALIRAADASFEKVGLGLNELDMSALRKMSKEDIATMFRVPAPLLGKVDEGIGLGRGNVETLEYIFAKYTIEPKLRRLDSALQIALERYYGGNGLRIRHENIIPEDKEHQLALRKEAVDRWMTRNEIRLEDGLDYVEGGDDLRAPLATIPIAEDASGPDVTGRSITIKRIRRETEVSHKEVFRLGLMRNQTRYERRFRKKLKPILVEQRREALVNLEAKGSSLKSTKDLTEPIFDKTNADQQFQDDLNPVVKDLARQQGALALVYAGDDESEFLMTPQIETFIEKRTAKMADSFNDETLARLNRTLAEGVQAGESLGKLKKRVEGVYDKAEGYRAQRLARTETLSASNYSTEWAYKQTGFVKGKQWYVNPGGCEICAEFDGKTVPLDEAFASLGQTIEYTDDKGDPQTYQIDYDTVEVPPLHPNCRCTVVPTT